jgi:hypothetical protein
MDDILSVTGREVPHITLSSQHGGRLWAYVHPVTALIPALGHRDWLLVAFWLVNIAGFWAIARFGQQRESRSAGQQVFFIMLASIAAGFVLMPGGHAMASRLVGLAIAPIPFLADVVMARDSRMTSGA